MKIENIQSIYMNGRKVTTFAVYTQQDGNTWVYSGTDYINGWFKRESTVMKKAGLC